MKKLIISLVFLLTAWNVWAEEVYKSKSFPPDEVLKYNIETYVAFKKVNSILGYYKSEEIYHVAYTIAKEPTLGIENIYFLNLKRGRAGTATNKKSCCCWPS